MEDKTIYFKNGSSITPIESDGNVIRSKSKEVFNSYMFESAEGLIRFSEDYLGIDNLHWYQKVYLKLLWKLRR
jgi:hypothetical protein